MDWQPISIVGSGVLGSALGVILREHGAPVEMIAGRDTARVAQAAARIGCWPASSVEEAAQAAHWILVAVPDDVVPTISKQIAHAWRDHVPFMGAVVHTSGALGIRALREIVARGAGTGVCHPLQSMMNLEAALEWLPRSCFGVSGHGLGYDVARQIAEHVSGSLVTVDDTRRPLYHAGACVASNYLTVLLETAGGLLMDGAGLSWDEALLALGPLIDGTLENVRRWGTRDALTGPVARGDVGTVRRHLAAMRLHDVPQRWFDVYRTLGEAALEVAEERGLDLDAAEAVRAALRAEGAGEETVEAENATDRIDTMQ